MTTLSSRRRSAYRALGLLAVLLALAGRLAAGMVVADAGQGRAMTALLDAMIQCQSDGPASPGIPGPAHHEADHALCALASVMDLPSPTLTPLAVVPFRRGVIPVRLASMVSARDPPAHPPGAALPRGPPILV